MKETLFLFLVLITSCQPSTAQTYQRIVLDENDTISGYYAAMKPGGNHIEGVLLLMPGFGQSAESILPESKLPNVAFVNNILTIFFAGGHKAYCDTIIQRKLTVVVEDVMERFEINREKFVLGGFSAGGIITLRYAELCAEFPDKFPIQPKGVFVVDSPVDLFTIWDNFEETVKTSTSDIALNEAKYIMAIFEKEYGNPKENVSIYKAFNPFAMNKQHGENEQFLKDIAVRAYHDVDIEWRLKNRNQPVRVQNYLVTSELINRLLLMGNEQAEFIQTYQTGFRSNGKRHPHSWSVVEEVECIQWVRTLLK